MLQRVPLDAFQNIAKYRKAFIELIHRLKQNSILSFITENLSMLLRAVSGRSNSYRPHDAKRGLIVM